MNPLQRAQARLAELGLRHGRPVGLRTAKTALAAVVAYLVALEVSGNTRPVLAPLTALLVVQVTLYETLRSGLTRVLSVITGVLVALGFSVVVGFHWWSLGALIAAALVIGKVLRIGEQLLEVPISAMLVLAVSHAQEQALGRVYETLVGAAVGIVINAVIAPPLYLQSAGDAIRELADRTASLLDDVVEDLHSGWSHDAAKRWLDRGRELPADIARAQRAFARAESSMRLNPRAHRFSPVTPSLRAALAALEHAAVAVRVLVRAFADRAAVVPDDSAYDEDARLLLAAVVERLAVAIRTFGAVAADDVAAPTGGEDRLIEAVADARSARDAAAARLVVDPTEDAAAWEQHGSMLANIGRVLGELDPDADSMAREMHREGLLPRRRPNAALRDAVGRAREGTQRLRGRAD